MSALLLVHAAATLFMTGLIWFVQVVHYPLFRDVGTGSFVAYEHRHTRLTTAVVWPPMLVELVTAIALVRWRPEAAPAFAVWVALALVVAIWFSTALLQVPAHRTLAQGFDEMTWRRLVRSNWLRTILWTARSSLALWFL